MKEIKIEDIPKIFDKPLCEISLLPSDIENAIHITFWKDCDDLEEYLGAVIEINGIHLFFKKYVSMNSTIVLSSPLSTQAVKEIKDLLLLNESGFLWVSPRV